MRVFEKHHLHSYRSKGQDIYFYTFLLSDPITEEPPPAPTEEIIVNEVYSDYMLLELAESWKEFFKPGVHEDQLLEKHFNEVISYLLEHNTRGYAFELDKDAQRSTIHMVNFHGRSFDHMLNMFLSFFEAKADNELRDMHRNQAYNMVPAYWEMYRQACKIFGAQDRWERMLTLSRQIEPDWEKCLYKVEC